MGKITGWRACDDAGKSGIDDLIYLIRKKSIDEYGRPDVPSYVQRAAQSYALRKMVPNRKALDALIAEAGSFEILLDQLSKEYKNKKSSKMARDKAEAAKKPKSQPSQFQRAVDASKRSKYVLIVLGGAPGLGKKA